MKKHIPRKRFGQHFLHERYFIERIVDAINPNINDIVIEIGPGQGAITDQLIGQCGELHIIELDKDLVDFLSKRYADVKNVTIHSSDILNFNFKEYFSRPAKLVGNLPYNISTPIIFHLFNYRYLFKEMIFMFQKEVVDRLLAEPNTNDYSRLSVMTQFNCRVQHLFDVAPGAFNPPPKVMSSVARLMPLNEMPEIDEEIFSRVVKSAFSQRRKMVKKNLQNLISAEDLLRIGVSETARAQELTIDDFIKISAFIGGKSRDS